MPHKNYFHIHLPQRSFEWHFEDAWKVSKKFPIFAVADGVTVKEYKEIVNTPSDPKIVADLFCEKTIESLEKNFAKLSVQKIKRAYEFANKSIQIFNKTKKENFGTVGALVTIKDNKIFGSRVTDCGFALFRNGKMIFKTPEFWSWKKRHGQKNYGVLNGKMKISKYINLYDLNFKPGDILTLFTDGFENHFTSEKFRKIFRTRNLSKLKKEILKIDKELNNQDEHTYGLERTLLALLL